MKIEYGMTDPILPVDCVESLEPLSLPLLPSPDDNLFSSPDDWWNNACLNWYPNGWSLYADGYQEAADLLVKHIDERKASQDTLVYPVLFLYRQYLELAIKDLIRQSRHLQDISGDFPKNHRIDKLWEVCHKLLSDISPGDSVAELKEIGRLINEFSEVDPSSMAFRYPQDKDGKPSLPGISRINLRNVRDVIGKISNILLGANLQVGEYLSIKQSMERDFSHE